MDCVKRALPAVLFGVIGTMVSCSRPAAPLPTEINVVFANELPSDPSDAAWQKAPEFTAALVPQDLVEPRQLAVSTSSVRLRALSNGNETAFRLEWDDPTRDDVPGASRFCDACAVQLPHKSDASVPAPQMGETGRRVEIAYWNASHQALVDGRGQSIRDLYPNATVDHYPFDARPLQNSPTSQQAETLRYAPARAVGNPVAATPASAVQDLVGEGPGTLAPAPAMTSRGKGARTATGWAVVIIRTAPVVPDASGRANIALAVWDGAREEAGARKMRTGWIPTVVKGKS